jgi:hypothetical protein
VRLSEIDKEDFFYDTNNNNHRLSSITKCDHSKSDAAYFDYYFISATFLYPSLKGEHELGVAYTISCDMSLRYTE